MKKILLFSKKNTQLGSELIVNGDMSSSTGWTLMSGWAIGSGTLNATSTTLFAYQIGVFSVGKTYRVQFDVTEYTSGSFVFGFGNNLADHTTSTITATGSYSEDITVTTLGFNGAGFDGITSFTGKIDNVSVKEIL